jgi:hypothetical protein
VELLVLVVLVVLVVLRVRVLLRQPGKAVFKVLHESLRLNQVVCPSVVNESVLVLCCSDLKGLKVLVFSASLRNFCRPSRFGELSRFSFRTASLRGGTGRLPCFCDQAWHPLEVSF